MPEKRTVRRAKRDLREGKSPSTAAGEFVKEEIEHVREGKHGARSAKQAIAIGLSKARRAGIPLPNRRGKPAAKKARHKASARRSRAMHERLKREPRRAASHRALSRQSHRSARRRSRADRSRAARRAAGTRRA
jgi:Family of unknown function (DUF6496)